MDAAEHVVHADTGLRVLTPEEWVPRDFRWVAQLKHTARDIAQLLGCKFYPAEDGCFGDLLIAGFQTSTNRQFLLIEYLQNPPPASLAVRCLHDEAFPSDLDGVLEALGMDLHDLRGKDGKFAVSEEVRFTPHALLRQDDNGVRYLVDRFPCRCNATKRARELESHGHKQTFWTVPLRDCSAAQFRSNLVGAVLA